MAKKLSVILLLVVLTASLVDSVAAQNRRRKTPPGAPNPPIVSPINPVEGIETHAPVNVPPELPVVNTPGYSEDRGIGGPDTGPGVYGEARLTASEISQQAKAFLNQFGPDTEVPIRFENEPGAPLFILDARAVLEPRRRAARSANDAPPTDEDDYVIVAKIKLLNTTKQPIITFGLTYRIEQQTSPYKLLPLGIFIDAFGSYTLSKRLEDYASAALVNPDKAVVKVTGVKFVDSKEWGESLNRSVAPLPDDNDLNAGYSIDKRPMPLNSPSLVHTDEARANRTEGTVRMRVLIGTDGNVKQVNVMRGLADGLTEEAIKGAFQLRFTPAMKNGQPVPFWQKVDIEFWLK